MDMEDFEQLLEEYADMSGVDIEDFDTTEEAYEFLSNNIPWAKEDLETAHESLESLD